ncbi:carboxymuconolactone decarboxylase family protein, partial [Alphaproteobacteria bacterium]|nr:carboxymuconolactone decarboxylase family protein [Alphaproteobacteria bacterium]
MTNFTIHSLETVPSGAEEAALNVSKKYGSIPNLLGALLEAPEVAQAYIDLGDALKNSAFTPEERHVVWFTINRLHDCRYCMAAHTAMAKGEKIDAAVIEAARGDENYPNERLNQLKEFTTKMVVNRGWIEPVEVQ